MQGYDKGYALNQPGMSSGMAGSGLTNPAMMSGANAGAGIGKNLVKEKDSAFFQPNEGHLPGEATNLAAGAAKLSKKHKRHKKNKNIKRI